MSVIWSSLIKGYSANATLFGIATLKNRTWKDVNNSPALVPRMSVLWCLAVNLRGPLRNILRRTMFVKNWGVCAFFAKILQNYVVQQIFTVGNSSCGKVMFSQVCVKNSVHSGGRGRVYPSMHWSWGGGCVSQHALGRWVVWQTPPWADTLPAQTAPPPPPVATAPDGMHPTGMHSCWETVLGSIIQFSGAPDSFSKTSAPLKSGPNYM